ncbi:MAG: hypothetical protein AAFY34_02200 [Pseudomonadota bacterium]
MVWIFRALMVAGLAVAVMSVAVAVLIFVNFDVATCGENCSEQTRFILLTPSLVLGLIGMTTAYIAHRLGRREKLQNQADLSH